MRQDAPVERVALAQSLAEDVKSYPSFLTLMLR